LWLNLDGNKVYSKVDVKPQPIYIKLLKLADWLGEFKEGFISLESLRRC
jgi:hypothetical protein